jgi:hypothetical protein
MKIKNEHHGERLTRVIREQIRNIQLSSPDKSLLRSIHRQLIVFHYRLERLMLRTRSGQGKKIVGDTGNLMALWSVNGAVSDHG